MNAIGELNKAETRLQLSYDCLIEWRFAFCLQQNAYARVG